MHFLACHHYAFVNLGNNELRSIGEHILGSSNYVKIILSNNKLNSIQF